MLFRKALFAILLLFCAFALLKGYLFYEKQLASTPLHLLVFVPDCPLYVLLTLPIILKKISSPAYSFIVSVGMAKYGIWTLFIFLFHWDAYSSAEILPITLLFSAGHICMVLLGLSILPKEKVSPLVMFLALGWFLLNDFSDYFWGTVPEIPPRGISAVRDFTFFLSFLLAPSLFFFSGKIRELPGVRLFRMVIQN
ncbi:MAG: DUF1405 domain-containing protein [Candidatus Micrarchaeota archaeon]|nr:DUF1405 domain-containing protein [Candidatus Micrarchaeota archaeon]